MQPLVAVSTTWRGEPTIPASGAEVFRSGMVQGKDQGPGQAPEHSARLLPSFLGPDGPVETNHLITGMGQVTQRVVCVLRKDDLGREETGSNSTMSQAPLHGLDWGRQVPGDAPLPSSPQMPGAALTHHGHQGERLLLQLSLDTLGNVSDVRQGEVLELLRTQVPRMGLKQLECLPGTRGWESCTSLPLSPGSFLRPVPSPCLPACPCPHAPGHTCAPAATCPTR